MLTPSPLLALSLLVGFTILAYRCPRAHPFARLRHILAATSLWAWCCCTPAITNALVTHLEGSPTQAGPASTHAPAPDGTIVILGSGQLWTPGKRLSPRLDEDGWIRLHEGVRLWRLTGGTLIFTGGPGGADKPTLAGQMAQIARELGVPTSQIVLAVHSTTTYEDIVAAQAHIRERGSIWLVTSAIHMPRAMAVARQLGLDARPYPVNYLQIHKPTWRAWLPDNAAPARMNAALHEIVGRVYYQWRGRAS